MGFLEHVDLLVQHFKLTFEQTFGGTERRGRFSRFFFHLLGILKFRLENLDTLTVLLGGAPGMVKVITEDLVLGLHLLVKFGLVEILRLQSLISLPVRLILVHHGVVVALEQIDHLVLLGKGICEETALVGGEWVVLVIGLESLCFQFEELVY